MWVMFRELFIISKDLDTCIDLHKINLRYMKKSGVERIHCFQNLEFSYQCAFQTVLSIN